MTPLINLLVQKTSISQKHVENILKLIEEGSTIPFIARYRKEMTGGASDEQLREFENIYGYSKKLLERKDEVARLIEERGHLSADISALLAAAASLQEVEDIYRPYKEKKNTRAALAIAAGFEPLANLLEGGTLESVEFCKNTDDAIKGAQDILAERYSDDPKERD